MGRLHMFNQMNRPSSTPTPPLACGGEGRPTNGGNVVRDFQLWPVVVFGGWLSDKLAEHHWYEDED